MKQRYLQAMGVETWRLRAPQAVRAYYCYTLRDAQQQPIALLMADVTVRDDIELNLVAAIAKATRFNVVEGLQPTASATVLILLGPQVVVSYSPAQLLADKSLKAVTWRDVRMAMGILGIRD